MLESVVLICGHCQGLLLHLRITFENPLWWTLISVALNIPLIADDLFINFDDRRTAAGLKVLGELSRKMQVVFLTHHDHLVPLAREVLGADMNVVLL